MRGSSESDVQAFNQIVDPTLVATLPLDPSHILVEDNKIGGEGDIYSVDVENNTAGRIMKGSEKFDSYQVDLKGELRARRAFDYDNGKVYIAQQVRDPDTNEWVELFRSYAKDRDITEIVGFTDDPHVILIANSQGGDKTGIYEYDIKQRKVLEPAFQHKLFAAGDDVITSEAKADFGRLLGFTYDAENTKVYWLDGRLAGLQKAAEQALGVSTVKVDWVDPGTGRKATIPVRSGAAVDLIGWSDDMKYVLLEKSGPRQPPEYYLLNVTGPNWPCSASRDPGSTPRRSATPSWSNIRPGTG